MSRYVPPTSNADRLTALKKALETGTADATAGNNYVASDVLKSIDDFLVEFEPAVNNVSKTLSASSKEVRERVEAVQQVEVHVRDLWEVLKRRVARLKQPAEVLTFYQLPQNGIVPVVRTLDGWITMAGQVVQGDADAVKAGYPAMLNPSAADVQAVLTRAQAESADVAPADRAYDQAQEVAGSYSGQADALITEVMDQLRFTLRAKDASSQRRIMRSYGAKFEGDTTEATGDGATEPQSDGTTAADTTGTAGAPSSTSAPAGDQASAAPAG